MHLWPRVATILPVSVNSALSEPSKMGYLQIGRTVPCSLLLVVSLLRLLIAVVSIVCTKMLAHGLRLI